MQRRPVSSSNIAEVGYDAERRVLEVLFHSGGLYQYFDVPQSEYVSLMRAGSHGQYLNRSIKDDFDMPAFERSRSWPGLQRS